MMIMVLETSTDSRSLNRLYDQNNLVIHLHDVLRTKEHKRLKNFDSGPRLSRFVGLMLRSPYTLQCASHPPPKTVPCRGDMDSS